MTKKKEKLITLIFFLIFLAIGIFTFTDYGISIEEHTQLYSGIYWLDYVYKFLNFDFLKEDVLEKLELISSDSGLPDPKKYTYGPIFDLPTAFFDLLIEKKQTSFFFYYRHFLVFLVYYLGSIYVFKIFKLRFKNLFLTLFGTFLFIYSPRVYGDSFHNNKDIVFLSLVIVAIYFFFKIIKKKKN